MPKLRQGQKMPYRPARQRPTAKKVGQRGMVTMKELGSSGGGATTSSSFLMRMFKQNVPTNSTKRVLETDRLLKKLALLLSLSVAALTHSLGDALEEISCNGRSSFLESAKIAVIGKTVQNFRATIQSLRESVAQIDTQPCRKTVRGKTLDLRSVALLIR